MANEDINQIVKELGDDESLLLEIFADPVGYNESSGGSVGEGGPYPSAIGTIVKKLLPDWSDKRITNTIRGLESLGLVIDGLADKCNVLDNDRGIRMLQNKLTEKGKKCAELLSST